MENTMDKAMEKAQNKFISYIVSVCDDFGLNRFIAQVYGLLYMSATPLSLDEIAERLGASKGNVSINIRELEKWGAVRSVWVKGSRKDYYEIEPDIKKFLLNKVKSSMNRRINALSDMLTELGTIIQSDVSKMDEEGKKRVAVCKERLHKVEDLRKMAFTGLSLVEKLL